MSRFPRAPRFRGLRVKSRSIKAKIFILLAVPLLALVALWGFAVTVTLGDSLRSLKATAFDSRVVRPTEALISALQNERRQSLAYLGGDLTVGREGFEAQRKRTDQARADFRRSTADGNARNASTAESGRRVDALSVRLVELDGLRRLVDGRAVDRQQAFAQFNSLIDDASGIFDGASPNDPVIAKQTWTITELERARENLSREDALLTGALAAGRFSAAEHAQFVQLVGAQRFLYQDAVRALPAADRARFDGLSAGPEFGRFRALEDTLVTRAVPDKELPVDVGSWHTASESVVASLVDLEATARAGTSERAESYAAWVILRLALAGGLGLIAVVVSTVIAFRLGRRLIGESRSMAGAVDEFAHDRLPEVTALVRRGEKVDPDHGAPVFDFTVSEVRRIYDAFLQARRAVITATVSEAAARQGLSEVFLNLARRNQVLLHRLLRLLDDMERRVDDADELADLFRLDHLATRMRRHAEGLVILSGRPSGRTWRRPVPVVDVARAAVAEIEDYTRVRVAPLPPVAVVGAAVADIIHLFAELIENATVFSPPELPVQVRGELVVHGFVLEIEDRGLGIDDDETLAGINERLAEPPEFDLFDSARLGLFVVARLAQRHGVKVTLRRSAYGGTTAIVLIPSGIITVLPDDGPAAEVVTSSLNRTQPVGDDATAG
ncbi:MAG: histidine kinase [Streptosporangiaceae bacterium]|jgi:signal transduction histidine kinase|nr:histidine kinase [Streptosporangiaceae bacterium]